LIELLEWEFYWNETKNISRDEDFGNK